MTKPGSWMKRLLIAAAALGLLLAAFLAGFVVHDLHLFPSDELLDVKSRLQTLLVSKPTTQLPEEINTALLRLSVQQAQVPGDMEWRGGGITRVGDELLGLTGAGQFFRVSGQRVSMLDITPPPHHLDEYRKAAATPELASLQHNFTLMRYNTPLYVASDERHLLFITYTEWQPDQHCYVLALARLEMPASGGWATFHADADAWNILFRTRPCLPLLTTHEAVQAHMGGGAMAFDASTGRLLLTTGDYRVNGVYAPATVSHDEGSTYGRLFSLDLDGGSVTQLTRGLRNAQGLLLLPDGTMGSTEHGARGGD